MATFVIGERPPPLRRRAGEALLAREPPLACDPLLARDPLPPFDELEREALDELRREVLAEPRLEEPLFVLPDARPLPERALRAVPLPEPPEVRPREVAGEERLDPLDEFDDERLVPLADERLRLEVRLDEPRSAETDISFLLMSSGRPGM